MPIVSQDIVDGPSIHKDGSRRGVVEFVFDDARRVRRNLRAPDALSWANLLIDIPSEIAVWMAEKDAEEAADSDDEVNDAPLGEATREELALAFLRKAYSLEDPYRAYLKFTKFNTYRVSQGWTLDQVQAALASAGLTVDEWATLRAAYEYLSDSNRVAAMVAHAPILSNWSDRAGL